MDYLTFFKEQISINYDKKSISRKKLFKSQLSNSIGDVNTAEMSIRDIVISQNKNIKPIENIGASKPGESESSGNKEYTIMQSSNRVSVNN